MSDNKRSIEGEGSHTAARRYNEETKEFVDTADVEGRAEEAKKAVDGAHGKTLREAEEKGRAASAGEDPQVKRP